MTGNSKAILDRLSISGDVFSDSIHLASYATDASAYREYPLAVVYPRDSSDVCACVRWALDNKLALIPRGAGTSLAGQVVGNGVVMDVSRYMTSILDINPGEKWVRVQPGIVRDTLNDALKVHGLFFSPETSTTSRCTIGGMVGNNSCGLHSLIYGSTRDKVMEVSGYLSDGTYVTFAREDEASFKLKASSEGRLGEIYRTAYRILSDEHNRQLIEESFPHKEIRRRNNGYALDELLQSFNFAKLIAGSEGTLMVMTEVKLSLDTLPSPHRMLVCVHMNSVDEALKANLIALKFSPSAVELMDKEILDRTADNAEQRQNRFFLEGDPGAILIVEFTEDEESELEIKASAMETEMRSMSLGMHFPRVKGADIQKVWNLRKSGLGVLTNTDSDSKPVSVTEDTAIRPEDLPGYISEFRTILSKYNLQCVFHGHISTGELHLRPMLNLKKSADVRIFRDFAQDVAFLVRKYRGSLSGEHGDGRLRGEFIPLMYGEQVYLMFKRLKYTFDPDLILNPGKITDTPAMNSSLRYMPDRKEPQIKTFLDFSPRGGILRAIEKCNGSGDCRRLLTPGRTMCPSYMATGLEINSTRARANVFREYLTVHAFDRKPFDRKEIRNVLDNCLLCKGCKTECPSNVDMAMLKEEFLYQWQKIHGIPLRSFLMAEIDLFNSIGRYFAPIYNKVINWGLVKRILGIASQRNIPGVHSQTFRSWLRKNLKALNPPRSQAKGYLCLFVDEFTDKQDVGIGIKTVQLLCALGYHIIIGRTTESGRAALSKGMLPKARRCAEYNIRHLSPVISDEVPLVGIEPSCILSFKDEYPVLVSRAYRDESRRIAASVMTIEEFFAREYDCGRIRSDSFKKDSLDVLFHGHCQQKAIISTKALRTMLSIPSGVKCSEIPSGCCGMAGSFGYEKEHYDLSVRIGEQILFPAVRNSDSVIVAPGTSCRHHIREHTGKTPLHPVEFLHFMFFNI